MNFYIIVWQSRDGHKMVEVFTNKEKRDTYCVEANFNTYGNYGADLEKVTPQDITELANSASCQFH